MGSNFLYDGIDQPGLRRRQDRHVHGGSDVYTSLVQQNNIKPGDYGLATLPLDSV